MLRAAESVDDCGQRCAVDPLAGPDGFDAQSAREMGFSSIRRAEQMHDLGPLDEVGLRQCQDATAIKRGLEREVEALQPLDRHQPGDLLELYDQHCQNPGHGGLCRLIRRGVSRQMGRKRRLRKHYNTKRPYSALGYRPPAPEAIIAMDQRPVMH